MGGLTGIPRERVATHGAFEESAIVSQMIKATLRSAANWARLNDEQKEAVEMIAFKLARIVSGDPNHIDHWNDIGGYAQLGARACHVKPKPKFSLQRSGGIGGAVLRELRREGLIR